MAVLTREQALQSIKLPEKNFVDQIGDSLKNPFLRLGRGGAGLVQGDAGKFQNMGDRELYKDPMNVIKDIASLASTIAPGGGIKGAATAGALSGFGSSTGKDANQTLINTLLGAGTGGALGLAGKGINAVAGKMANKNAQKAIQTATKEFNIDELYNQIGKPAKGAEGIFTNWQTKTLGVKGSKNIVDKPQVLVDNQRILNSLGFDNSEKGIQKGISKLAEERNGAIEAFQRSNPKVGLTNDALITPLESRLDDIVLSSDKNITKEQLRGSLNKYLQQSKYGNIIDKQSGLKNLALPDLQQIASSLKGEIRNATPRMRESAALQAKQALVEQIDSTLEKLVPETSKYNRVMASLYNSQEATGRKALNSANMNTSGGLGKGGFFGLGDILPVQEWTNKGYEVAGKAGNALVNRGTNTGSKVAGEFAQAAIPNQGTKLGNLLQNPELAAILAPILQTSMQVTPAFAASPENGPEGLASGTQNLAGGNDEATMIAQQLLASGMKPSDIKTLQEIGAIPKTDTSKDPVKIRELKNSISSSKSALSSLVDDFGKFNNDTPFLGSLLNQNPFDPNRQGFATKIAVINQNLAKALEGGKLTDADRDFYKQNLLSANDTPSTAKAKYQVLMELLQNVEKNL